jgi:hypothetical protein
LFLRELIFLANTLQKNLRKLKNTFKFSPINFL